MVSNDLLAFAAENYDFDVSTLHFISDSTNQIYMFNKNEKGYILRFSQRPSDMTNQTKAEMDWLYYLAGHKIGVSLPLKNNQSELVISTNDHDNNSGENYIITAFEMANGRFWDKNDPNRWNDRIFFNWGKLMGDMHRLTKDYKPANENDVRETFNGRFPLSNSIKSNPRVNKITEELIGEIMALPKDKDSYGLIHYDMHQWNFYIDGDKINVFDFDDSVYGWFALDIGVALYHALWWGRKDNSGKDFTDSITENFLKGYLSANNLSDFWIAKIPMFMKYRQICKFSWFYDPENTDEHQKERMYNIENNILFTGCETDKLLFDIK
jgi:Ser/Thr protein kinase RdoA (MazF antagonist)